MLYRIGADIVVVLHFFWIVFLIFGALIGRRYGLVKALHIAGMGFALVIQIFGWYCPLTYLEVWLRRMHDPWGGYEGSFIVKYVRELVYVELSGKAILIATVFLVLISTWLYVYKPKKKSG